MPEMFTDDDAARRALQTLNDEPAPPVMTTVDQVLRRGRRQVVARRASAVAGVVAVVAAIGATTVLALGGDRGQEAAAPPERARPEVLWDDIRVDKAICEQHVLLRAAGTPPNALPPRQQVETAFTDAITDIVSPDMVRVSADWQESPLADGSGIQVVTEVPMEIGDGQLQLDAQVYAGTPTQAADRTLYSDGDCRDAMRRTLDDGTVLQLYPADNRVPQQPVLRLFAFRPDGRAYVITATSWTERDLVPIAGGAAYRVDGGHDELPATERQLSDIAMAMFAKLG